MLKDFLLFAFYTALFAVLSLVLIVTIIFPAWPLLLILGACGLLVCFVYSFFWYIAGVVVTVFVISEILRAN